MPGVLLGRFVLAALALWLLLYLYPPFAVLLSWALGLSRRTLCAKSMNFNIPVLDRGLCKLLSWLP